MCCWYLWPCHSTASSCRGPMAQMRCRLCSLQSVLLIQRCSLLFVPYSEKILRVAVGIFATVGL